jgi:hypothetical protein
MGSARILFKEEQRFNQWWLKLVLFGSAIIALGPMYYGTIMQFTTGEPWGDKPMSDTGLIVMDVITTVIMAGVIYLIFGTRMITEINSNGVYVRFKPFLVKEKSFPADIIEKYEVRKYNPVADYGGWGVKHGRKGIVYNVSGNMGLLLWLKNNKKLMIGTHRPEAVKRAMNKMMNNNG